MGARQKLNAAYFSGSLLLAAVAGWCAGSWWAFLLALAVLLALMLAGGAVLHAAPAFAGAPLTPTITAPPGVLPAAVVERGPSTVAAYRAALEYPDALAAVPCTCGCAASLGHRNNEDCYVAGINDDGSVVFASHALDCAICKAITADVVAGVQRGLSGSQLHDLSVARYAGGQ